MPSPPVLVPAPKLGRAPATFQGAASQARVWCGEQEGKARQQQREGGLAEHRAEVLCSCAALKSQEWLLSVKTAKVRSNTTGLPSLTKNAVGQRQATTLFA